MIVPNRVCVVAGEKFSSCGMALGRVIKLSESQSLFCLLINVWGFDFTTIAAKV